jgi:hypothetical protein
MFPLLLSALVLLGALAPAGATAPPHSLLAIWTRIGADGTTLSSSLSVSGSSLIAQTKGLNGSLTTDFGPIADVEMLAATICTNPQVMMITVGLKGKSFHEIGDDPRNPADFYEDMFFLQFGDAQTERRVARALAILTGVSVQYDSDCTSSE